MIFLEQLYLDLVFDGNWSNIYLVALDTYCRESCQINNLFVIGMKKLPPK